MSQRGRVTVGAENPGARIPRGARVSVEVLPRVRVVRVDPEPLDNRVPVHGEIVGKVKDVLIDPERFEIAAPSLEEIFVSVVQKEAGDV